MSSMCRGAHGVTVMVVENGIRDLSSNHGRDRLHFYFMQMPLGKE